MYPMTHAPRAPLRARRRMRLRLPSETLPSGSSKVQDIAIATPTTTLSSVNGLLVGAELSMFSYRPLADATTA